MCFSLAMMLRFQNDPSIKPDIIAYVKSMNPNENQMRIKGLYSTLFLNMNNIL